jgi:hypothetical protein
MINTISINKIKEDILRSNLKYIIASLLDMIEGKRYDKYYSLNSRYITVLEKLAFSKYLNRDIYDYLDIAIKRGNYRFIYCDTLKDFEYYTVSFKPYSEVKEDDITISTYFIAANVNEIKLVTDIIVNHINDYLNINSNYTINDLVEYINTTNINDRYYFNNAINLIDIYILFFELLDSLFDLKYDDMNDIIDKVSSILAMDEKCKDIAKYCYIYAITKNNSPEEMNELIENCINIL